MAKNKKPPQSDSLNAPSVTSPAGLGAEGTMQVIYAQIAQQQMTGPIPSPDVLRQYDALSPGLADRLVRLAEQEAEHRRKVEFEVVAIQGRDQSSYRRSEFAGQICGLLIGLAAIGGAVIMALHGAQIAASLLGTGGVTGLVTAFILGRTLLLKQKKQEFDQAMKASERHPTELKSER